jgi:PmbA protein
VDSMNLVAASVVEIARDLDIQKYDIVGFAIVDSSVQVNAGKPQQMKASQRNSVTVRVWNKAGTAGIASTNSLDVFGLREALITAKETADFGNVDELVDFSPECLLPLNSCVVASGTGESGIGGGGTEKAHSFVEQPVERLLSDLLAAEKAVLAGHSAISSLPYNGLSQRSYSRFYCNSLGAFRFEETSFLSCYLYTRAQKENGKPRSAGISKVVKRYENLSLETMAQEVVKKTESFLDYVSISNGAYLVVFSGDAFLALLDSFSNMFNARNVIDKQSLHTAEDLNTQVASEAIDICDFAFHEANASPQGFDGEGTPTRRVEIVSSGILRSFLHSAGTAKIMGVPPTGNASMGSKVTVTPHFWQVSASTQAKHFHQRNLDSEQRVILIDEVHSLHAGVNALQGSFSLPFSGWIVENGRKTSVESATVAGDFREMLKKICFVEQKEEHTPSGVCPRVWVEGLSITSDSEP